MVRTPDDIFELLLPDAPASVRTDAKRVTAFLRTLIGGAARVPPAGASPEPTDVTAAARELELHQRERVLEGLDELLRRHLEACLSGESFAWLGPCRLDYEEAWRRLADQRVALPAPGESPDSVAARLVEAAAHAGMDELRLESWRVRLARARAGPADQSALEARLGAWLTRARRLDAAPELYARGVEDLAACLLDRGAVRSADELLRAAPASGSERLERLRAWCALLLGAAPGPAPVARGGPVPAPLLELRAEDSEGSAALAGAAAIGRRAAPVDVPPRSRRQFGASVFAVLLFRRQTIEPLLVDAAPALAADAEGWFAERDGVWRVSSEPEHRLFLDARPIRVACRGAQAPRGSIGATARALALAPILDRSGEVAGWLHIECEHRLLPSSARLRRLAKAWESALPDAPVGAECVAPEVRDGRDRGAEPGRRSLARLFESLEIKVSHRRWWGFEPAAADAGIPGSPRASVVPIAEGGAGLSGSDEPGGEARALSRALATGGVVHFSEPDPRLSVHRQAASGLVAPLRARGRIVGLFVLESSRRRDFRPSDVERIARVVAEHGIELRVAQLRVWHRDRFGIDVAFDTTRPAGRSFAERVIDAGRAHGPALLSGPAGAGKLVLARWLHFESAHAERELRVLPSADPACLDRVFDARGGGPGALVLDDVEELAPRLQARLVRTLEGEDRIAGDPCALPRLFATTRLPLDALIGAGALRPDLGQRLQRIHVRVPPLSDRREEIPALVRFFTRRFAAEEGLSAPSLEDAALGLLWRQPWEGNVRELENVTCKLVLAHAGERVGADRASATLRAHGLDLATRLPSRHPRREDLLAALAVTCTLGGRPNKTRAASYLGWDPDTLVARMREAHVTDAERA